MGDNEQRSKADVELEREIRKGRKFNLADAIGRMAGPGAMKGVSPVPLKQQAVVEIDNWLLRHLTGAPELRAVLLRHIDGSELLLHNFEQPLLVLAAYCRQLLDSDYRLRELVREADVDWGRTYGERPLFDKEGVAPNPADPYTVESVRATLTELIEQLSAEDG